jgi:hypothetical protein
MSADQGSRTEEAGSIFTCVFGEFSSLGKCDKYLAILL